VINKEHAPKSNSTLGDRREKIMKSLFGSLVFVAVAAGCTETVTPVKLDGAPVEAAVPSSDLKAQVVVDAGAAKAVKADAAQVSDAASVPKVDAAPVAAAAAKAPVVPAAPKPDTAKAAAPAKK
jgi:hypothetical protein